MSGCADVCLDQDLGYYNDFFQADARRAIKEHECGECGRTITVGEHYGYARGSCEGDWFTAKTCAECGEIREALICGEYFFACLWDDLREHVYPRLLEVGPSECFAEIPSKTARDKLDADFQEWARRNDEEEPSP